MTEKPETQIASKAINSIADDGKTSDPFPDYDDDVQECANCGGEGFVYGCSWDWQCDTYDEGEGTCLCTRRCEWCTTPTDAEIAERQALRKVLGDALRTNEGTA